MPVACAVANAWEKRQLVIAISCPDCRAFTDEIGDYFYWLFAFTYQHAIPFCQITPEHRHAPMKRWTFLRTEDVERSH